MGGDLVFIYITLAKEHQQLISMSSGKTCTDYNNNGHIIHITGFQFQGGNIHLQLLRLIAKEYIQQQFY